MSYGLFTNSTARKDFIDSELRALAGTVRNIYIASAFFTEHNVLETLAQGETSVLLVVRLGFPTSPIALEKALKIKGVQVRYFTDSSFHPKLYIFGDAKALVGSANLTGAAIKTNQEILLTVDSDDERFAELETVFDEYWTAAKVLTDSELATYKRLYNEKKLDKDAEDLERRIQDELGRHAFPNIQRGLPKPRPKSIFLDSFRRTYQTFVDAFRGIRETYEAHDRRKFSADRYPLRLEINLFVNFVRDAYAPGESWRSTPLGWLPTRRVQMRSQLDEWIARPTTPFETETVDQRYPRLTRLFSDRPHLLEVNDDELFEGLCTVTSLEDRLRFFPGGLPTLRAAFLDSNAPQRIRTSLAHLIFDKMDTIERMGDLLYDPDYKLNEFGQANVQELLGWLSEDLPVVNGRTTKVLRYFGFDVRQLS
jgi:hypothetical protein